MPPAAASEVGKIDITLPDQGSTDRGTLAIPCTVSLVAGAPHPDAAKKLIDFLLSAQTDRALIDAKFAWCSARDAQSKGKFMDVDYHSIAEAMPAAISQASRQRRSKGTLKSPAERVFTTLSSTHAFSDKLYAVFPVT